MAYPKFNILLKNILSISNRSPNTINKCAILNFRRYSQILGHHYNNNYCYSKSRINSCNTNNLQIAQYSNNTPHITNDESDYKFRNVLLIRKITRYEYERQLLKPISKGDFKARLIAKGSDYKSLLARHTEYIEKLQFIQDTFRKYNIQYKTLFKFDSNIRHLDWCDAIVTAGGDGMFLSAASRVSHRDLPILGINTDTLRLSLSTNHKTTTHLNFRSEGKLCLSKFYSNNLGKAIERIQSGNFKWYWRNRIRTTLSGTYKRADPIDLHRQRLLYPELRYSEHVYENEIYHQSPHAGENVPEHHESKILPSLALNEVFIGESLSARVSSYEIAIEGVRGFTKEKSSGLTASTGTGSSSWYFNINHIPHEHIYEILNIANEISGNGNVISESLVNKVSEKFNSSLLFSADDCKIAYTIRDPIAGGIFRVNSSKGFCRTLDIKSRMWDGWIVIDGAVSFQFNDGAKAKLSLHDEDALRCFSLD